MADQDFSTMDEVELLEAPEDTGKGITSALVIATFVISLVAFIAMEYALGKWYGKGPFGG